MCVHNNQNWNCNQCCYPSVPTAWSQWQSPYVQCSPCATSNPCLPVSPCGLPASTTVPPGTVSIQYASFVLGPNQLFASPLAKYTIVAAPGAGLVIEPILTRGILKVVTAPSVPVAYDDGLGSPPVVNFNIGSNILFSDTTILGGLTDRTRFYTIGNTLYTSTLENLPLEVGASVIPTAGNSTLYIRVLYAIVTL